MKTKIWIVISLNLISCTPKLKKIETFYNNGNTERVYYIDRLNKYQGTYTKFYSNGRLEYKTTMRDDKISDTTYVYENDSINSLSVKRFRNTDSSLYSIGLHQNGATDYIGLRDKYDRKIGTWIYFSRTGDTLSRFEYKIINGESYPNQIFIVDTSAYSLKHNQSCFIQPETYQVKIGDSLRVIAQSTGSPFDEDVANLLFYTTTPHYGNQFPSDFSGTTPELDYIDSQNIDLSLKYTTKDVNAITKGLHISPDDYYKTVIFYYKPFKIGQDTIRGLFTEMFTEKTINENKSKVIDTITNSNSSKAELVTIYFDIPIKVIK